MAPRYKMPPRAPGAHPEPPRDPVTGHVLTPTHLGKEVDHNDLHPDLRGLEKFKEKHRREAQVIFEEDCARGECGTNHPDGLPSKADAAQLPLHQRMRLLMRAKERLGE